MFHRPYGRFMFQVGAAPEFHGAFARFMFHRAFARFMFQVIT